jgi:hypothetical protein
MSRQTSSTDCPGAIGPGPRERENPEATAVNTFPERGAKRESGRAKLSAKMAIT